MPFNGSGVFQRVRSWVADATAGIKIRADYHDAEDDGIADGLTNCITKDGQTIITQNIPWNSKRITGLEDPVNAQDAATKHYADVTFGAGGKMTGDLEIEKDHPTLTLDDTDSAGAEIIFQHQGKTRWIVKMNADAESGTGNAGSNFNIERFADDGTTRLGIPQMINRATGRFDVKGDLYTSRGDNTGVIFFGDDSTHYLYWNGTTYSLPAASLTLGNHGINYWDAVTVAQLNNKQNNLGFTPVQQSGGAYQATNKIYIGWDGSGLRAQVDASDLGQFVFGGGGVVRNGRLAHAGDYAVVSGGAGINEPYGGAVMSGFQWTNVGYPVITYLRFRYMQLYTTGWFTCGYA